MSFLDLFDVKKIVFSAYGYDMSYLELIGTVFNLWAVWLTTKAKILSWPVGIVAVLLFMILFYQVRLYSDFVEQIYYFVTCFYGWWLWARKKDTTPDEAEDKPLIQVSYLSRKWLTVSAIVAVVGSLGLGYFMKHIQAIFPAIEPAAYPYTDAFTTVLSFMGQIYTAYKKMECWLVWIVVNVIGVWLYFEKGVWLVSMLFFALLLLAIKGYYSWKKQIA